MKRVQMRFLMLFTITLLLGCGASKRSGQQRPATKQIQKEKWHWDDPAKQNPTAGYAQVVKVDNILYISGAVSTEVSVKGITEVYTALKRSLNSFGADFSNVVKENLYTTDIEAMKANNGTRLQFYNDDFPSATWVQVARLYMPDARLEVELIAHLPKK